jgi:hypothetical protein
VKKTPAFGPGSGERNKRPDKSSPDTALDRNRPITKIGALRDLLIRLLQEHERDGALPSAPGAVYYDELPYLHPEEAQALIDDAVALLVRDFGYNSPQRKQKGDGFDRTGTDRAGEVRNILGGHQLHDSITALAAKLIVSGMSAGAVTNFLHDLLQASDTPRGERFDDRLAEIPRAVDSAQQKFGGKTENNASPHVPCWTVPPMTWRDPAIIPRRQFLYGHYYARGFISATIADGGLGKSILKTAEFLSLATGKPLLGITPTERVRVLYWSSLRSSNPKPLMSALGQKRTLGYVQSMSALCQKRTSGNVQHLPGRSSLRVQGLIPC